MLSLHESHHEAQKYSITTLPRSDESRRLPARLTSGSEKSGAERLTSSSLMSLASLGRRPTLRLCCSICPPRVTLSRRTCPTLALPVMRSTSWGASTWIPLTKVIRSPFFSPACAAGEVGSTRVTRTPPEALPSATPTQGLAARAAGAAPSSKAAPSSRLAPRAHALPGARAAPSNSPASRARALPGACAAPSGR